MKPLCPWATGWTSVRARFFFRHFSFFANRPSAKIVSSTGNASLAVPLSLLKRVNDQMNGKKVDRKAAMNRESALLFISVNITRVNKRSGRKSVWNALRVGRFQVDFFHWHLEACGHLVAYLFLAFFQPAAKTLVCSNTLCRHIVWPGHDILFALRSVCGLSTFQSLNGTFPFLKTTVCLE